MIVLPVLLMAAEPADSPPDCEDPQYQQLMNICAAKEFEEADKALNEQWKKTAAVMKQWDADGAIDDGRPGYFATLLDGQRAWLAYRDKHCLSEGYLFRGGSMEPFMLSTCKTRLTKLRIDELRELESEQ